MKGIRINHILDNIEDGVFLLNKDLDIGKRYSRALEKIFNDKNIASQNFLTYLEDKLPKKLIKETSEYLDLLISGEHDAELLSELNPLSDCKFTFTEKNSVNMIEKFLDIKFQLVENTKSENQIIAIVKDVTKNARLAQKLSAAEAKSQQQLEWMINLIHVDSDLLNEFMTTFHQELMNIQTLLRESENKSSYSDILKKLYQSIHGIKERAGLLDLNLFDKEIHDFEDEIALLNGFNSRYADGFNPQNHECIGAVCDIKKIASSAEMIRTTSKTQIAYLKDKLESMGKLVADLEQVNAEMNVFDILKNG